MFPAGIFFLKIMCQEFFQNIGLTKNDIFEFHSWLNARPSSSVSDSHSELVGSRTTQIIWVRFHSYHFIVFIQLLSQWMYYNVRNPDVPNYKVFLVDFFLKWEFGANFSGAILAFFSGLASWETVKRAPLKLASRGRPETWNSRLASASRLRG